MEPDARRCRIKRTDARGKLRPDGSSEDVSRSRGREPYRALRRYDGTSAITVALCDDREWALSNDRRTGKHCCHLGLPDSIHGLRAKEAFELTVMGRDNGRRRPLA